MRRQLDQSIIQDNKKVSDEILEELEKAEDASSIMEKDKEWKNAMSEELRLLDERQSLLVNTTHHLTVSNDNFRTMWNQFNITHNQTMADVSEVKEMLKNLQNEIKTLRKENDALKEEIKNLQEERERDLIALKKRNQRDIEEAFDELDKNIQHLTEEVNKSKTAENQNTNTTYSINNESSRYIKLQIPKFKGEENERPMRYLND